MIEKLELLLAQATQDGPDITLNPDGSFDTRPKWYAEVDLKYALLNLAPELLAVVRACEGVADRQIMDALDALEAKLKEVGGD